MIKIAHRGNLTGPHPELENYPFYVLDAIKAGYDAEVDFWVIDGKMYFGHNNPEYPVDKSFVLANAYHLWLHCKNLEALDFVLTTPEFFQAFWHQEDDFTITTNGFIWTYPGKPTTNRSILVCKEMPTNDMIVSNIAGICSPYIGRI